MRLHDLTIVSKKIIATRIICFFWLIAKVISWKAWLANRLFPIVPPFNFLFVPAFVHLMLFIFSLLALLSLLLFPSKRLLLISIIVIEVLACLFDQNRWQPWEYEYIFIILALLINYKNDKKAISSIAFIFISVYVFSGIGKMNPAFSQYFQQAVFHNGISHTRNSYLYNFLLFHSGYLLGSIEIFLGISLFSYDTKKISAALLILMHLIIIALFGPWGINYDIIILPWNMAFLLILYLFFIRYPTVSVHFYSFKKRWNGLFIIFFGILPFLNFFGYWDFYLSSSLFSYKTPEMYVYIHKKGSSKVLQSFFSTNKNKLLSDSNTVQIKIREWSFHEIEVPVYPELRVYKNIKSQLLQRYPDMIADFIVYRYINGKRVRIKLD
jgi:hypothetical protein